MLTLESLNADKTLSVFLAISFAEKALPIWKAEYPEDMRPIEAIEAAKAWLSNPSEDAVSAAAYAASDAYADASAAANAANAAYAANAAADAYADASAADASAAYAAYAAAAAADAADAAYAAADAAAAYAAANAAYAANAAADAAAYAAAALGADKENLIHEVILENLDWILQYKIENGQSFAQPELILKYLSEEQGQRFLFNLDKVA